MIYIKLTVRIIVVFVYLREDTFLKPTSFVLIVDRVFNQDHRRICLFEKRYFFENHLVLF